MKCPLLFGALVVAHMAVAQSPAPSDSSITPFGLHLAGGLMLSEDPLSETADALIGTETRGMTSVYVGFLLDTPLGEQASFQIGGQYARRGAHFDDQNGTLINHFIDGHVGVLFGSEQGRIGPVATYTHAMGSSYTYVNGLGEQVREEPEFNLSPLAVGLRGEVRMQEGTYLTAGLNMRLDGSGYDHASVGLRIDLNRKSVNRRKELRTFEKYEAARHIQNIKDGALLVRLNTLDNSINALRGKGMDETAAELEDAIRVQNIAVMNAFEREFSFCPVYFYYSYDAGKVKNGDYQGTLFNAKGDSTLLHNLADMNCYIAEFGNLENDTSSQFIDYTLVHTDDFSVQREARYARGSTFNFSALKIKGPDFYQLRSPFPYYVKTYGTFIFNRSPFDIVSKLNDNFYSFYTLQQNWPPNPGPPLR